MSEASNSSSTTTTAVEIEDGDTDDVFVTREEKPEAGRPSSTRYALRQKRRRVFEEAPNFFSAKAEELRAHSRKTRRSSSRMRDHSSEENTSSEALPVVVVDDDEVMPAVDEKERDDEVEEEAAREDAGCDGVPRAVYESWCRTRLCTYAGVAVTAADLRRLKPGCLFNDVVVEFYLRHLERCVLDAAARAEYEFFSPFFIKKLSLSAREAGDARRWTRGIDVFAKRFLVVPINECRHWVLALVCLRGGVFADVPGPAVLFFDSLGTCSIGKHGQRLRKWLSDEWAARSAGTPDSISLSQPLPEVPQTVDSQHPQPLAHSTSSVCSSVGAHSATSWEGRRGRFNSVTMPSRVLRALPHQENNEDCGVFILHYVEWFALHRPPRLADLGPAWFDVACIAHKRTEIRDLILAHAGPMRDTALAVWNYEPPGGSTQSGADVPVPVPVAAEAEAEAEAGTAMVDQEQQPNVTSPP